MKPQDHLGIDSIQVGTQDMQCPTIRTPGESFLGRGWNCRSVWRVWMKEQLLGSRGKYDLVPGPIFSPAVSHWLRENDLLVRIG